MKDFFELINKRQSVRSYDSTKTVEKEKKQVDTKQIIVDAVSALATLGNEYSLIRNKVSSNHLVLESAHNTFFDKF